MDIEMITPNGEPLQMVGRVAEIGRKYLGWQDSEERNQNQQQKEKACSIFQRGAEHDLFDNGDPDLFLFPGLPRFCCDQADVPSAGPAPGVDLDLLRNSPVGVVFPVIDGLSAQCNDFYRHFSIFGGQNSEKCVIGCRIGPVIVSTRSSSEEARGGGRAAEISPDRL